MLTPSAKEVSPAASLIRPAQPSPCHVAGAELLASCGTGCLVVAGLTTYLLFPETSGIPVEQTHTVFKDHWAWPRLYPEILQVSLLGVLIIEGYEYLRRARSHHL